MRGNGGDKHDMGMMMDENVMKAMIELSHKAFAFDAMVAAGRITQELADESLALADGPIELTGTTTIRARLVGLEASNQRLREVGRKAVLANADLRQQTYVLESRLAAADALLRKCRDEFARLPHSLGYDFTHLPEIDAHLSENGHD